MHHQPITDDPRAMAIPLFANDNDTIRAWTLIDVVDYEFVRQWDWRFSPAGSGYAVRHEYVDGQTQTIPLHRALVGAPAGMDVDHRNSDSLDNRRRNLRIATHAQNQCNRRRGKNSSTGFKGVRIERRRHGRIAYSACVTYQGKDYKLGVYARPEDAAIAYNRKAVELFGEFAQLNVVDLSA